MGYYADPGFTESERALQAIKESRELHTLTFASVPPPYSARCETCGGLFRDAGEAETACPGVKEGTT